MQELHNHAEPGMTMPVVRIIAKGAVCYSINNGITVSEFDPGEFYDVADHVAAGMVKRGWAKLMRPGGDDEDGGDEPPPPPLPPSPSEPKPEPQAEVAEPPNEAVEKRAKSRR